MLNSIKIKIIKITVSHFCVVNRNGNQNLCTIYISLCYSISQILLPVVILHWALTFFQMASFYFYTTFYVNIHYLFIYGSSDTHIRTHTYIQSFKKNPWLLPYTMATFIGDGEDEEKVESFPCIWKIITSTDIFVCHIYSGLS